MTIAKYIRLSDADEERRSGVKDESDSVANQRRLLDGFLSSHTEFDGCDVLEFLDDGRSGTNFNRPGIRALVDAAKRGEVNCIVVKDFSRFGRTSLEVGKYMDYVFPFLGVRFIAVNNGYDSKKHVHGTAGDIEVGVYSILNEEYSRDLSVKVKASRKQYAQRGQCINAYPFYGYVKSPSNRRKLVPDPPAAEVVRRAFALCADGRTNSEIARILNEDGVPTPTQRKRELGAKRKTWNSEREVNEWTNSAVLGLLREERYTGKLMACRKTRREMGDAGSSVPVAREDWIVVPDAFEAIVTQAEYDAVQKILGHRPRREKGSPPPRSIFYRKLKCGFCDLAPARSQGKRIYYQCNASALHSDGDCSAVRIFEDELTKAVLASIRFQATLAVRIEQWEEQRQKRSRPAAARARDQIAQLTAQKSAAFADYNAGRISKEAYDRRCGELNCRAAASRTVLADAEAGVPPTCQEQMQELKGFQSIGRLDAETVDRLIERIRIFDSGRIEIVWKFTEPYAALIEKYEGDMEYEGS